MAPKTTSTKAIGLAPGKTPVKTQKIPPGTLPNPTRPADTFRKSPATKRTGK